MNRQVSPERRRFGQELRTARNRAGLSQAQVARELQVVQSAVSSWETGVRGVSAEQAAEFDRIFGTSGVIARAWSRANEPRALPLWYDEVEQLELAVSELREYQSQIVPGLIQTESYIRALLKDSAPWATSKRVGWMVKSRARRQQVLDKEDPPLLWIVMEAAVIEREIGGKHVMKEQLDRMLHLVDKRAVRIQVMPREARCHPGAAGPFRIYTFPEKPLVASAEHMLGEKLTDDMMHVQQCTTIFGTLQAEALSPSASSDLIRKVKDQLDD